MRFNEMMSLRAALETLLSPFDDLDAWRDGVCDRIRTLTGTDVVFFRLSDRGPSRIAPLGPLAAREAYRRDFRSLDPWPRHAVRPGESRIDTHEGLIGPGRLRRDRYYNDFLRPYGVHEYVGVQVGTTPGQHAHLGMFNSDSSRRGTHREDTTRKLRTVLPAFQAGLSAWVAATRAREALEGLFDDMADPLFLGDEQGRLLHANAAMRRLLMADFAGADLRNGLERTAREMVRARQGTASELLAASVPLEVTTRLGTYRVRGVNIDASMAPGAGALLLVEPPRRRAPTDSDLAARYGLTPRETDVVRRLTRGHSNEQIAAELDMAATTARNHTARGLRKLGLNSRAQVHALLHP